MCLLKHIRYTASTWEAFKRLLEDLDRLDPKWTKPTYGTFWLPETEEFNSRREFDNIVKHVIEKYKPKSNKADHWFMLPLPETWHNIFVEVWVKIK